MSLKQVYLKLLELQKISSRISKKELLKDYMKDE